MMLLRSPDGREHVIVKSLDGYDGWQVVNESIREPAHGEELSDDGKAWRRNTAKAARDDLLAIARNPERLADLLESILARLPKD